MIPNLMLMSFYFSGRFNNFTPIPWTEAFAERVTAKVDYDGVEIGEYSVYLRYKQIEAKDFDKNEPIIVFLHGCGHSALTWGETILETDQYLQDVQMAAIDLRGHGLTQTNDDYNLSFDVLQS
jgi:pimeloyl-ACP methyl ester carboxylesterase